jgi:hypothetical protein
MKCLGKGVAAGDEFKRDVENKKLDFAFGCSCKRRSHKGCPYGLGKSAKKKRKK